MCLGKRNREGKGITCNRIVDHQVRILEKSPFSIHGRFMNVSAIIDEAWFNNASNEGWMRTNCTFGHHFGLDVFSKRNGEKVLKKYNTLWFLLLCYSFQ